MNQIPFIVFLSGWVLLSSGACLADPVQGGVLGAGVGAAIGGPRAAVIGGALGVAGGKSAETQKEEAQKRWDNYYKQQNEKAVEKAEKTDTEAAEAKLVGSALIKEIQRSLVALGYDPGPIDGLTNGPTIDAIRSYQEDNQLVATGMASQELLQHIQAKE